MLSCHKIRLEQDDLRSLEHITYCLITNARNFLLPSKNLQISSTGNKKFLYPASTGLVGILLTWGISVTLAI
jgi:hypothetical protein